MPQVQRHWLAARVPKLDSSPHEEGYALLLGAVRLQERQTMTYFWCEKHEEAHAKGDDTRDCLLVGPFSTQKEAWHWPIRPTPPSSEAAEQDAARYRWLRSNKRLLNVTIEQFHPIHRTLHGDLADSVIDGQLATLPAADQQGAEMTTELRPEVAAFAEAMELQLRKNGWKGHWRYCTGTYLFNRIRGEVNELSRASTAEERLKEAADVANFAMMIADNAKRREAR
jgi:hypothetical protein